MRIRLWLLLSVLVSAISWQYASRIQGPWLEHMGLVHDGVKTQMGDL